MPVSTDDRVAWERLAGEPARAFHGFCHFRDTPGISIDGAWRQHATGCDQKGTNEVSHRRRPTSWTRWSIAWDWVARRDCFIAFLDNERRRKFLKEQQDATARHLRLVLASQQGLAMQLKVTLEATQPPTAYADLKASYVGGTGLQRALEHGRDAIRLVPSVVEIERLLLGLTTSIEELREERRVEDPVERAIVGGGAALDHALAILDIAARTKGSGNLEP